MSRLFLFFVACVFALDSTAQLLPPNQPEQDACNALVLCGNTFTTSFSYQGIGVVSDLTNTPCSGGENNSMWMRLNVVTGGVIVFNIIPLNSADDYDFAVVDITNSSCSTFTQADVIRCNFNNNLPPFNNGMLGLNTTSTITSVPAGATGNSYLQQLNANPGDVYLIMINNFGQGTSGTNPSAGFTIDFSGTSATFNGPTPAVLSVIPSCNNASQITLQMNHNIVCSSISSTGSDFTVAGGVVASETGMNCSGSNGYTDKITVNFAAPLPPGNYNLVAQLGNDGNTLLNTCNIPLPVNTSVPFTVQAYDAPAYDVLEQPNCTEFRIKLNKRVACNTIAADGSDFSISGPQGSSVLYAYGVGCDTANFTDTVAFVLQKPLQTDGTYTITAQSGTDGNTLLDSCGIPQNIGNSINFNINSWDGQVIAMDDTVVCSATYVQLTAQNNASLPPADLSCGTSALPCSGNASVGFVGGTDSLSDANSPFYGGISDQRAQYLYLASELKRAGLKAGMINALQWKVTQKRSTQPYANFSVRVGCSALSSLSSSFAVGSMSTVFTDPAYVPVQGWNTIQFTSGYNWDGVSNIIVEVCFDNFTATLPDEVAHSVTSFTSVLRRISSTLSGCSLGNSQGTLGVQRNLRPKARFFVCAPPDGVARYIWSPGTLLSDSTEPAPLAFINTSGSYQVAVFDRNGCAHRDSLSITLSQRTVDVHPKDTTVCFGQPVALVASGGLTYNWVASDPSTIGCATCASTNVSPPQTTTYSVMIGDQYNCLDTLQSVVHINPLPPVHILEEDMLVKYGQSVQLNAAGATYYTWYPAAQLNNAVIGSPVASIIRPVTLYVVGIDEKGCRNQDSIRITVDYSDKVFIPTAFSPNGDGKNDVFKVGSLSFQRLSEFKVFNRWGEEVFSTTDPASGWDGTFHGVPQEIGVYNYIIRLAYPDGKTELYKGSVTLVR